MPIDREVTLRNAEKLLRVGRLDAAIAEYARVVDDQPRDWTTANTLGDLYLRAGQQDKAVELYRRIADHLLAEGFYPRAAALLKKILKLRPDDESALVHLGEIAARQGLLVEAKGHFGAVAAVRARRGDAAGADEMALRLGALDPADLDARLAAARAHERRGAVEAAASAYRQLYDELVLRGREADARGVLADVVRCSPEPLDVEILQQLVTCELQAAAIDSVKPRVLELLTRQPHARAWLVDLANGLADLPAAAAEFCIDVAVDSAIDDGAHADAVAMLESVLERRPNHLPALLRLVEVAVEGGLGAAVEHSQIRLADAYLARGHAGEARVIAEDLLAQYPADPGHMNRLRQALVQEGVSDVDAAIVERLSARAMDAADAFDAPGPASSPAPSNGSALDAPGGLARGSDEDTDIDLTALVADLQGTAAGPVVVSEDRTLDQVFAEMRDEAAAHPGAQAADEHLELAQTYVDVGMRDEAVAALVMAAKSPRHRFEAAAMLARLHREAGDLPAAIDWYERAAEAPAPSPDRGRQLLYDLGDLLETAGEHARALAIFLEIAADTPGYLDVDARLRRLAADPAGG